MNENGLSMYFLYKQMKTSCLGCSDILQTLNKVEKDPPHLFFSGCYGSGKTSLATDFLKHYFSSRGAKFEDPNWCLQIRSDQDRGIHRIRETITEFVRRTSLKPGVYRWIFIDDADSLPVLSQQALRRPMETHFHTTRFLFCSRYQNDLIPPLRSRCLHIECTPLMSVDVWNLLKDSYELPEDPVKKSDLLIRCPTVDKLKLYGPLWKFLHEKTASTQIKLYPDRDPFYNQTLRAILKNDKDSMIKAALELYGRGHSFEDCLYILSERAQQNPIFTPDEFELIQKFFIQGWIYTTQGRTGFLDLLDLFLTRRWEHESGDKTSVPQKTQLGVGS
jgi:hypothetical protein